MPCFSVSALNGFWEELSENQSPSTDSLNPTKWKHDTHENDAAEISSYTRAFFLPLSLPLSPPSDRLPGPLLGVPQWKPESEIWSTFFRRIRNLRCKLSCIMSSVNHRNLLNLNLRSIREFNAISIVFCKCFNIMYSIEIWIRNLIHVCETNYRRNRCKLCTIFHKLSKCIKFKLIRKFNVIFYKCFNLIYSMETWIRNFVRRIIVEIDVNCASFAIIHQNLLNLNLRSMHEFNMFNMLNSACSLLL